jgi:hypothetical protein
MKRLTLALAIVAALMLPATVTATRPKPEHKVTICHALPEDADHDYQRLEVDIASSGYVQGGHHVPGGSIGDKHSDGGDIIPPYEHGDFEYPGQNWTAFGQAIWRNDCVIPPPQTPPDGPEPPVVPPPNLPQGQPLTIAPPPPAVVHRYAPAASIFGPCGDPRVIVTLDNSHSTLPAGFKVIYKDAKTGDRTVRRRTLAPGLIHYTDWLWVKGNGNFVRVRDQYQTLLARVKVIDPTPWGEGTCPESLK